MTTFAEVECWCEYVDIGVGWQRVAENPDCPRHVQPDPDHDRECEAEFIHGPMAWSPCRCAERTGTR